jgi:hypothetical protein
MKTRTASAIRQRVADLFADCRRRPLRIECAICPRYVAQERLSRRGWCQECELEFRRVLAALARRAA